MVVYFAWSMDKHAAQVVKTTFTVREAVAEMHASEQWRILDWPKSFTCAAAFIADRTGGTITFNRFAFRESDDCTLADYTALKECVADFVLDNL